MFFALSFILIIKSMRFGFVLKSLKPQRLHKIWRESAVRFVGCLLDPMKRSFAVLDDGHQTYVRDRNSKLMQPDFDSLGVGLKSEPLGFPMPGSIEIRPYAVHKRTGSFRNSLDLTIRNQYLEDQLNYVAQNETIFGRRLSISERYRAENKFDIEAQAEHDTCGFSTSDDSPCHMWHQSKLRDHDTEQRFASCCASLCSTIASAASTVSSVAIPSPCHQPSPPDPGRLPLFAMECDTRSSFSSRPAASHGRRFSASAEAAPSAHAALADPASPDSPSDLLADAATFAACWMMLKVLEQRAGRRPSSPPPPPPAAGDLEEFSLGPGRPAA